MDAATQAKLTAEKADLQVKLKARTGKPGYSANCFAIRERLGTIAKVLADG